MATPATLGHLKRSSSSMSSSALSPFASSASQRPIKRPKTQLDSAGPLSRIAAERSVRRLSGELSQSQIRESDSQVRVTELESLLRSKDSRIQRLEADRQALLDRALEKAEERQEAANEAWIVEQEALRNANQNLTVRVSELQDEAENAKVELRSQQHANGMLQNTIDRLQTEVQALQEEVKTNLASITAKSSDLDRLRDELVEVRCTRNSTAAQDAAVSSSASPSKDKTAVIQTEMKRQLRHIKALETSNQRLKAENDALKTRDVSVKMLREQVNSLEIKLRASEDTRSAFAEAELERDLLKSEKAEWTAFLDLETEDASSRESRQPRAMAEAIAQLKADSTRVNALLAAKTDDVQTQNRIITELEDAVEQSFSQIDTANVDKVKAEVKFASEQRTNKLIQQERDFLKAQLETYAAEEANLLDPALYDKAKTERIAQLEKLGDDLRSEIMTLKTSLQHAQASVTLEQLQDQRGPRPQASQALAKLARLTEDFTSLQAELSMSEKAKESLTIAIDRLSHLLGLGAYNPNSTKVLCLKDNPSDSDLSVRTSTLEGLRAENKALLARISIANELKEFSAATTGDSSTVPREAFDNQKKQLESLQHALDQKEKAQQRLREAFRAKAAELRNAVALLLGYKLDVKDSGQIRLSSVFANSTRHLLFESTITERNTKIMRLVGDGQGLSETEARDYRFWVADRRSIPCFLASILLTQYDEVTRGGKHRKSIISAFEQLNGALRKLTVGFVEG